MRLLPHPFNAMLANLRHALRRLRALARSWSPMPTPALLPVPIRNDEHLRRASEPHRGRRGF